MPKNSKNNKALRQQTAAPVLTQMRRRIAVQAGLALTTIVLTVVIIFAMSAAWYTNIVHTNGLTFQVESWGFNGEIISDMNPIVAGPGDDGLIHLEVDSQSNSPSAVSVAISKTQMPTQMQKRIFFYADTTMTRNNETMSRVYLNSQDSYTYNLFHMGKLTLTEQVHNDAQLKWHWVYDVLGYYVQGTMLADGESISITEYLRPIEYDYDQATMEYVNTDGVITMELKTVDGKTTLEDFLVELSKSDGYEGTINPDDRLLTGYYPVDVDENGNGVYAYLCSYAEIQQNTIYDTQLGQGEITDAQLPYRAKLTVSAQKSKNSVINVSSLEGLNSAIALGAADVIQLTDDIVLDMGETLTISAGQEAVLDLNGNRIITSDPGVVPVVVEEGGSLTMFNGTLMYNNELGVSSDSHAMQATGAELVLSNVRLSGYKTGLRIADNSGTQGKDSAVRLVGCDWTTSGCTMLVYGNGAGSAQNTQLIIENSNLVSEANFVISGNGNATHKGTDIQILNSTLISNPDYYYSAIYHPQKDSVLTIYNSMVSGYTGIAIKGGTVNIVGATVEGHGRGMEVVEKFANSGFNDTGDAVYIETNYAYPIVLNISDLTAADGTVIRQTVLTAEYRYALRVYESESATVQVNITGGRFNNLPQNDFAKFAEWIDKDYKAEIDAQTDDYVIVRKSTETEPENGDSGTG